MNGKTIIISGLLLVAGIALGILARGYSDGKAWTTPVTLQ